MYGHPQLGYMPDFKPAEPAAPLLPDFPVPDTDLPLAIAEQMARFVCEDCE